VISYDFTHGVASRLCALSLDSEGRLTDADIASQATRAGLLVDLALSSTLTQSADAILIEDTTVDFPPAEAVRLGMEHEDGRNLESWLGDRRIGAREVARALVDCGEWSASRTLFQKTRFSIGRPDQRTADLCRTVGQPVGDLSQADASVLAIAHTAGLTNDSRFQGSNAERSPVPSALVSATGTADWLIDLVVGHIAFVRQQGFLLRWT